jgi:hypothetical protein
VILVFEFRVSCLLGVFLLEPHLHPGSMFLKVLSCLGSLQSSSASRLRSWTALFHYALPALMDCSKINPSFFVFVKYFVTASRKCDWHSIIMKVIQSFFHLFFDRNTSVFSSMGPRFRKSSLHSRQAADH